MSPPTGPGDSPCPEDAGTQEEVLGMVRMFVERLAGLVAAGQRRTADTVARILPFFTQVCFRF